MSDGPVRRWWATRPPPRSILAAGLVAAVASGAPSTGWALATGSDPLAAARAAASLAAPDRPRRSLGVGALVHAVISLGWTVILAGLLPARRRVWWGTVAGAGIAALDLGLIGRRIAPIRRLPWAPQLADHLAFGLLVGLVLDRSGQGGGPAGVALRRSVRRRGW
jgi:hypothetical protein